MTRNDFLKELVIEFLGNTKTNFREETDNCIKYISGCNFENCKKNKYNQQSRNNIRAMFTPIFTYKEKNIEYESGTHSIYNTQAFKLTAKEYLIKLLSKNNYFHSEYIKNGIEDLSNEKLGLIFEIIISIIFDEKKFQSADCPDKDNFDCQIEEIKNEIDRIVYNEYHSYDNIHERSNMNIFYISSILRKFIDIKDYISRNKLECIKLSEQDTSSFEKNVVYQYCTECYLKYDDDKFLYVEFKYNGEKFSSFTSNGNWIQPSLIHNMTSSNIPRYLVCYFTYDQSLQILQISE